MKLIIINDLYELTRWTDRWIQILEENDNKNPYITPDWITNWWHYFGNAHQLYVIIETKGAELIGICPLMITKRSLHKEIRFIGDPRSTYMDFIIKKGYEICFIKTCVEHLVNLSGCYLMNLHGMNQRNHNLIELKLEIMSRKLPLVVKSLISHYINLSPDFDSYYKRRRKHRSVKGMEKQKKRFEYHGDIRLRRVHGDDIDMIFPIHDKRWQKKNDQNGFAKGVSKAFFKHIAEQNGLKDIDVSVNILFLNEIPVAFKYGLTYKGYYYSYRIAHDPAFSAFSPGKIINAMVIKNAFERKNKLLDFLTGEGSHKACWTDDYTMIDRLYFVSGHGFTKVVIGIVGIIEAMKKRLKKFRWIMRFKKYTIGKLKYIFSIQPLCSCLNKAKNEMQDYGLVLYLSRRIRRICFTLGFRLKKQLYKLPQVVDKQECMRGTLKMRSAKLDEIWSLSSLMHCEPSAIAKKYQKKHYVILFLKENETIGHAWVSPNRLSDRGETLWESKNDEQVCVYGLFVNPRFRTESNYLNVLLGMKGMFSKDIAREVFLQVNKNERDITKLVSFLGFSEVNSEVNDMKSKQKGKSLVKAYSK